MKITLKMRVLSVYTCGVFLDRNLGTRPNYIRFCYSFTPSFMDKFLENFTFHTDKCEIHACVSACVFFLQKEKTDFNQRMNT